MQKTMYEVVWTTNDQDEFIGVTVEPVTVIDEGALPGCVATTITVKDARGQKFLSLPGQFSATEAEAWESARADLNSTIEAYEQRVAEDQESLKVMRTLAEQIKEN